MDKIQESNKKNLTQTKHFRLKAARKKANSQLSINNKTISFHFYSPKKGLQMIQPIPKKQIQIPKFWGCILPKNSEKLIEQKLMKQIGFLSNKQFSPSIPKKKIRELSSEGLLIKYLKRKKNRNERQPGIYHVMRKQKSKQGISNLLETINSKRLSSLQPRKQQKRHPKTKKQIKNKDSIVTLYGSKNTSQQKPTFNLTRIDFAQKKSDPSYHPLHQTIQKFIQTERKHKFTPTQQLQNFQSDVQFKSTYCVGTNALRNPVDI